MTGDKVSFLNFSELRHLLSANFYCDWAAGMKYASRWRIHRARDVALQKDPVPFRFYDRIWHGDCR
jgi:hypothetical protein